MLAQLKRVGFGISTAFLLSAPLMVGAQWDKGKTNVTSSGLPSGSIYGIVQNTFMWLLGILGFIAIIGFVIAGILYLTAAGNESQAEKAKNAMTYSIIGVIVALIGYVIVKAVDSWLNVNATF